MKQFGIDKEKKISKADEIFKRNIDSVQCANELFKYAKQLEAAINVATTPDVKAKDQQPWITDGGAVFSLKPTGKMKKVEGEYVSELTNDVFIRVQLHNTHIRNLDNPDGITPAAIAFKEKFIAEHIAELLNKFPPDKME